MRTCLVLRSASVRSGAHVGIVLNMLAQSLLLRVSRGRGSGSVTADPRLPSRPQLSRGTVAPICRLDPAVRLQQGEGSR